MQVAGAQRQSRLDDFLFALKRAGPTLTGTDRSTVTVTFVDPGSNDQSKVDPATAPISAATAPGIVERTESDPSMFDTTLVRNSPTVTDGPPLTLLSGRVNNYGLNVGVQFIHSFKYRRAREYRQLNR